MRDELERGLRRRRLLHRNVGGGGGGGSRQEVMFVRLGVPSLAMPKSANGRNKTERGDGEPKRLDGRRLGGRLVTALALIKTGAAAVDGANRRRGTFVSNRGCRGNCDCEKLRASVLLWCVACGAATDATTSLAVPQPNIAFGFGNEKAV